MKELSDISGALESKEEVKPGVYRSRLFGFIHRQAYRLREGVGLGLRQVKVSVQWTSQILLSPLRWFDRFKQNPSRQMAAKEKLQELPPTLTKPRIEVEIILAEVAAAGYGELQMPVREDWSVVDAKDWDTTLLGESQLSLRGEAAPPQRTKPVIRGLASLLADRSIVLVDRYNQILDVLSPSQQLHLQRQIDPMLAQQWAIDQSNRPELSAEDSGLLNPTPSQLSLPPSPPTAWQKVGNWLHFYREYLWIDSPAKESAGQLTVAAPSALLLPRREFAQPVSKPGGLVRSISGDLAVSAVVDSSITGGASEAIAKRKFGRQDVLSKAAKQALHDRSQEWEIEGSHSLARHQANNQSKTVFTPEWIETPTSDLGYHRSIFVQLMEWLDKLMLSIENWLIWIFQKLFPRNN
jgi:hypothetical protein